MILFFPLVLSSFLSNSNYDQIIADSPPFTRQIKNPPNDWMLVKDNQNTTNFIQGGENMQLKIAKNIEGMQNKR